MTSALPPPRPELLALLQAARDHPTPDAPRLVLADWLEEHGDESDRARAAFIRLQCARAGLRHDDPSQQERQREEQQLLDRYGAGWLGPVAEERPPKPWHFRRGLPIARYTVPHEGPDLEGLVGTELWAWVQEL